MGNTFSAHICRFKVFRPYPVILYRLRLDPSIYWWKKLVSLGSKFGVLGGKFGQIPHLKSMGNTICQLKLFRPYPVILYRLRLDPSIYWWKKLVSLRTTKFGILVFKATVLVCLHDKFPI